MRYSRERLSQQHHEKSIDVDNGMIRESQTDTSKLPGYIRMPWIPQKINKRLMIPWLPQKTNKRLMMPWLPQKTNKRLAMP